MEKAIFSITCTTCQARLAVRSEAAIGAILECPKCESMVHVVPPPGWVPAPTQVEPPLAAVPSGPPPLDQVHTGSLPLELEPADVSLLGTLSRHRWLTGGAAVVAVLAAACGLWLAFGHRPATHFVASEIESGTGPTYRRPPNESGDAPAKIAERPTTAVAGGAAKPSPPPPPGPQSGGVANSGVAKSIIPVPSPSAAAPRARDTEAAAADLFPPPADKTARKPAKDGHPIEVKKLPPSPVDVAARLADPLREIELTHMPLAQVVDLLAAISTAPITLDADAMHQLGVGPRDPISLKLNSTTVADALQAAASQRGLAAVVDGGQVIVTSPADYRETLRKIRYTVADMTGDDKAAVAQLAALVRRLVAPESWQSAGGRGTIEPDDGALVVVQTGDVHQQVLVFCERLRNARQKPPRSRGNPERFTLVTRLDQARKMLDRPVTVNFHEPAPLVKILGFLAETARCDILIDRAALAAAETSDRVEATLTVEKQGLGTALRALLRPLGLTFRAIDAGTIQVTTQEAADERLELEFYKIGPWLDKGIPGAQVAVALKARVTPSNWSDAGGLGDVCFDPPSRSLIVLQSQPVQAVIARLLAAGPK